jgi:hypothetical protein
MRRGCRVDKDDDEDFQLANGHLIWIQDIDCVDNIYKEFKGIGHPCQDKPIKRGLEACDARWKTKWRKHFNPVDQKRFSWIRRLTRELS